MNGSFLQEMGSFGRLKKTFNHEGHEVILSGAEGLHEEHEEAKKGRELNHRWSQIIITD